MASYCPSSNTRIKPVNSCLKLLTFCVSFLLFTALIELPSGH